MRIPIELSELRATVQDDKRCLDLIIQETVGMPSPVGILRSIIGGTLSAVGNIMASAGEAAKPRRAKAPQ